MSVNKSVYICSVCKKSVKNNCIYCEICGQWSHFKCCKISSSQFVSLSKSNEPFFCFNCLVQEIPFSFLSNKELKNLNLSNICSYNCKICNNNSCFCKNIFPFSQVNNNELFVINNSISNGKFNIQNGPIVTKTQYSCSDDFENIIDKDFKGSLSFLHINIRSLKKKNLS